MSHGCKAGSGRFLNRNFVLLWQGQFVSQVGNQAFLIAMMYWLMEATESASLMGSMMMVSVLPTIVLVPFGGLLADRYSRRQIIVLADAFRGLLVCALGLALLVAGHATGMIVVLMFVVVGLNGIFASAFQPAVAAVIPDLVPADKVEAANSMTQFSVQAATMLGQAVGGVVYGIVGAPLLFIIDGISYLLSAVSESFLEIDSDRPAIGEMRDTKPAEYLRESLATAAFVWSHPGMRQLLTSAAAVNFLAMPVIVLLPFHVARHLGLGPAWYGLMLAGMGGGSMLAYTAVSMRRAGRRNRPRIALAAMVCIGPVIAAMSMFTAPLASLALFALLGACTALVNVFVISAFQLGADPAVRGRVLALVIAVSGAVSPLGMLAGGFIGDALDGNAAPVYFGCGAGMLAVATGAAASRHIRGFLRGPSRADDAE